MGAGTQRRRRKGRETAVLGLLVGRTWRSPPRLPRPNRLADHPPGALGSANLTNAVPFPLYPASYKFMGSHWTLRDMPDRHNVPLEATFYITEKIKTLILSRSYCYTIDRGFNGDDGDDADLSEENITGQDGKDEGPCLRYHWLPSA
ncbi:uncharacterized protein LOC112493723 [Cephus cinctus]|uniref:Uncharacterized protein LOC112493723 n=1 Tax=Cephus cinctus TaxID=211228 RepID=A0AAJ7R977_CEPCN|nr:uncharacterized protein LOC112493723 [Cephus cinctus]XP_024936318.1 uncharacterized protein LOC112493723 [Cephus cinctus]